jgi:uncharacterized protein YcbK (DUF882 family)
MTAIWLAGCTATVGGDSGFGTTGAPGAPSLATLAPPLPPPGAPQPQADPNAPAAPLPMEPAPAFVPGNVVADMGGTVESSATLQPLTVAEARPASVQGAIIPAALPDGTLMPVLPSDAIAVPGSPGFAAPAVQTASLAAPVFPAAPEASSAVQAAEPAPPQAVADDATQAAIAASTVAAGAPSPAAPGDTPVGSASAAPSPPLAPAPDGKTARPARKGLLESLFGARAQPVEPAPAPVQIASASTAGDAATPVQELTSVSPSAAALTALPGVDTKNLFGIEQGNADEELYDDHPDEPVQLASATAAGLARLAPNGLLKQRDNVEVNCFKPELVRVLKSIERHYGKKLIVTSGYRSPKSNRRAGGSNRSMHIYCAAADIQIPGVGKWELAKFLRSMPGRGGVGTYCHTDSVHIDIGSKRDWNWRCRRR